LASSRYGWRWDYHTRFPSPNVRSVIARGVRAENLIPSFPSKTFPNHSFENVHVYNALAAALGLTPVANDGDPAIAMSLLRRE
jgi:hypothetical protein